MCPAYLDGLIGSGERKSLQPMAMRWPGIRYDLLHHLSAVPCGPGALEEKFSGQPDALVGGDDAWLIIDGTALPKKDHASVGVALRYALVFRQKC